MDDLANTDMKILILTEDIRLVSGHWWGPQGAISGRGSNANIHQRPCRGFRHVSFVIGVCI